MTQYDPFKKLFLVKRVHVPSRVLEVIYRKREDGGGREEVSEKRNEIKGVLLVPYQL